MNKDEIVLIIWFNLTRGRALSLTFAWVDEQASEWTTGTVTPPARIRVTRRRAVWRHSGQRGAQVASKDFIFLRICNSWWIDVQIQKKKKKKQFRVSSFNYLHRDVTFSMGLLNVFTLIKQHKPCNPNTPFLPHQMLTCYHRREIISELLHSEGQTVVTGDAGSPCCVSVPAGSRTADQTCLWRSCPQASVRPWFWRCREISTYCMLNWGFPGGSVSEESTCNAGDLGSVPG